MDSLKGRDYYDSYIAYQTQLIAQFDAMTEEFGFVRVDANKSILEVFQTSRAEIKQVIKGMKPAKKVQKKNLKGKPAKEKKKPVKETKSKSANRESKANGDRLSGEEVDKPTKQTDVAASGEAPPSMP